MAYVAREFGACAATLQMYPDTDWPDERHRSRVTRIFSVFEGKGVNGRAAVAPNGLLMRDGWYYVTVKGDPKGPFPTHQDAQLNAEKNGDAA